MIHNNRGGSPQRKKRATKREAVSVGGWEGTQITGEKGLSLKLSGIAELAKERKEKKPV